MASHNEEQMSDMEIEMVKRVHSNFPNGEPSQFHYFYATASPFSNFHPCSFTENGISFDTSEKYMMFHKALLFKDNTTAEKILHAYHPGECKALGRLVKNFDRNIWLENRTRIVSNGLMLKFTQDPGMNAALLKQKGCLLVEGAKNDQIWGVGLSTQDPRIRNRSNWAGLNLLGYILTDILQKISSQTEH